MAKKKAASSAEIRNFYEIMPSGMLPFAHNPFEHLHHLKLPFRMCIVSPSGSGKTNFLLNLIALMSGGSGTFEDITIITRVADEPLYNYLKKQTDGQVQILEGSPSTKTPDLNKMDKESNHLIIWDDCVLAKDLSKVEEYYIRARKVNCSCIFISQSFYHIPTMIRKNSTYIAILKLGSGKREISTILSEFGGQMTKEQLHSMYEYATNTKFVPWLVDNETTDRTKKFRKGFTEYLNPDDFLPDEPESP